MAGVSEGEQHIAFSLINTGCWRAQPITCARFTPHASASPHSQAVDKDGTSVLELSPVRRPREAGVIPSTILGLSGLKQLGLIVDAAHSQLMPLVEIGLIV